MWPCYRTPTPSSAPTECAVTSLVSSPAPSVCSIGAVVPRDSSSATSGAGCGRDGWQPEMEHVSAKRPSGEWSGGLPCDSHKVRRQRLPPREFRLAALSAV